MRRKLAFLILSLFLMAGTSPSFADRNDGRGGKNRQEQRGHRPNNGTNRNNNSGRNFNSKDNKGDKKGYNRPGNGNNHGNMNQGRPGNGNNHGNMNQGRPGNGNNHGNMNQGRPGNGNNHGNMNQGRPGNGNNHGNMNQGRPGGSHNNDRYRPGGNRPGGYNPGPGHMARPIVPTHGPAVPPPPPVVRPGAGFHYGPALPPPPPRLPYMVDYITRGCRDVDVWQIDSETFIVKYRRGGVWYTQYVYPFIEEYSRPTIISVNWRPMTPWTLIPPIQLNINL